MLYREWFPQIMYNHHQTGPTGTVLFAPPFRDPANYVFHPLVVTGLDLVGAAMHNRFVAENKPGATMRRGSNYSTWWNGGLRTTVYFHNMIGLLTETIGNPTPMEDRLRARSADQSGDLPLPIAPQKWHFRQSIDYSITANRAVLDVASRNRETFLFNIYRMGKNAIEQGSKDNWTVYPRRLQAVKDEIAKARGAADGGDAAHGARRADAQHRAAGAVRVADGEAGVARPARLRPVGGRRRLPDAAKFVNTLLKTGVVVHRATAPFNAGGKSIRRDRTW